METNFYKLSPEIKEFIIKEAKQHPKLGCRKLSGLIYEAFNLDISKSSVSSILKSEGLNKPAGRPGAGRPQVTGRRLQVTPPLTGQAGQEKLLLTADKTPFLISHAPELFQEPTLTRESAQNIEQKEPEPEMAVSDTGCWFLKAADLCLGGAQAAGDLSGLVENLLYAPLSGGDDEQESGFLPPSGEKYSQAALRLFFEQLLTQQLEISKLKFILEDNSCFFLDGAGHTIWSTNRIPEYFSSGLYKSRQELNSAILENARPLILQAAPGFSAPTPAWLNFITCFQLEKPDKAIKSIELYSRDNLLIDTLQPVAQKRRNFIFALWPWQYKETRQKSTEGDKLTMRPISYKKDGREILTIITNLEEAQHSNDEVIGDYLERWPNLETGYQDFLDKIGHFSQLVRSKISQKNNVQFSESKDLTLSELLSFWRRELNSYCQRHFFPSNCWEQDFFLLKERFYGLRARASSEINYLKLLFELPGDFLYRKDLLYSCQRINEADIHLKDGRKLRFEIE